MLMKMNQKRISMLALCLGITLAFSACQQSPEKEVVVGKETMQNQTSGAAGKTGDSNPTAAAPGALQETAYQKSFEPADNLRYVVDATVTSYDSSMPVFRAKPYEFTAEEVRTLTEYFFQGETAYENRSILTKEQIEKEILELTQWASDTEGLLACAGNEQEAQKMKENYEQRIQIWKTRYESAPETYQPDECDWEFHPEGYYFDEASVVIEDSSETVTIPEASCIRATATVGGHTLEMDAVNRTSATEPSHSFLLTRSWQDDVWNKGGTTGTEEEAIARAGECLKALGLDSRWMQKDCTRTPVYEGCREDLPESGYYYTITYLPIYNGYSLSDLPQPTDESKKEQYAMFYEYESLTITVADNEIIQFSWLNPLEITSVENAGATELSFDQIMERFGEQMELSYPIDWFRRAEADVQEAEIRISKIQRSLARIQIPDADMEFYLIPAWSFYGIVGTRDSGSTDLSFGTKSLDSEGNSVQTEPYVHAILAFNAMDGSVINIIQGY